MSAASSFEHVSATESQDEMELLVAEDGSIPADQLARLGLGPGAHLRVVASASGRDDGTDLAGSLPDLPDIDWETFQAASELARRDLAGSA